MLKTSDLAELTGPQKLPKRRNFIKWSRFGRVEEEKGAEKKKREKRRKRGWRGREEKEKEKKEEKRRKGEGREEERGGGEEEKGRNDIPTCIPDGHPHRRHMPGVALIQLILLMMDTWLPETCRE